ncbi:DNA polymerase Y family protein [Acidipila sp. EB88]|uniref:DNA polymerase Y family protein n=1 Tax=Acidipila sp. EB88 TaxID=2305226 RepID=UPI000F5D73FF|nr:DNA polymerase Y family protein [Acidipila sp. EB88]RRA48313.1 DNA polymerase Y family protein [Acidipila sp. EB88]
MVSPRTAASSFAAICVPEFPALAWLRGEPRAAAAAVIEGTAPLERVFSFNRAAKALGLTHGMSRVQAETAGAIVLHARSVVEEQAAMEVLFEAASVFSPRVQMVASPVNGYAHARQPAAVLLLDQAGMETLFGDAASFAAKLHRALLDLGLPSHVAVAPNAEASLLLARSYAGVVSVSRQELQGKLAPLPLSALRCEDATLSTLTRWGIRNLAELAALPEAALVSRIGQQGARIRRLARGEEERLFTPEEPDFVLAEEMALDAPLESLESLLFLVSPMLERVLRQAVQHAYALRSVTLTLELEKLAPHVLEVKPALPAQSRDLLLKLLNLKLQAEPPRAGIVGLALTAVPAVPQVAQRGLFQAQFPEPDKLDLLLARLRSIVGEEHVGSPSLCNSHRDDSFEMGLFAPSADVAAAAAKPFAPRSALRRFRPPQLCTVSLRGAAPARLFWKGERMDLEAVCGPWQTSGYWWDGRRWEASEWDAVVATPRQALRLRHEPGAWYVAGQYD